MNKRWDDRWTNRIEEVSKDADPLEYIGHVVRIPTRLVKQLPGQPRTYFDPSQMRRLRDSIAEIGQQQPAAVVPWDDGTFRLRDGERRWRCCIELKVPLITLVVEPRTEEEEFELSAAANMNRESHSPLEKALAMKRLRDGSLKRSASEIARTFGVSDVTVYNHLLILDSLPKPVIDLMDPAQQGDRRKTLQLSVAIWLTALKDYPADQMRLAKKITMNQTPIGVAKRMIDTFAASKKIEGGRGQNRKPSSELRVLHASINRLRPHAQHFCKMAKRDMDEFFEYMPIHRHEELIAGVEEVVTTLQKLLDKLKAVENVGTKRSAA
jgi:ParB/RepB/Spo0J family partition protein